MAEAVIDTAPESHNQDPSKFISSIIGSSVIVRLHNGVEYLGTLQTIDGFMNVVLENGKELINGKVNKVYGDVFVRGNNGKWIYSDISALCVDTVLSLLYITSLS